MCSRYNIDSINRQLFMASWAVSPPDDWTSSDIYPGYLAPFLRRPREADAGDDAVPNREAVLGRFGLLPFWAKDEKLGRQTYNAQRNRCQQTCIPRGLCRFALSLELFAFNSELGGGLQH